MKRTEICLSKYDYPEIFHKLLEDSKVYDSSCSKAARVIFVDKDNGYYLKCSEKGSLKKEDTGIRCKSGNAWFSC